MRFFIQPSSSLIVASSLALALAASSVLAATDDPSPFSLSINVGVSKMDNRDSVPDDSYVYVHGTPQKVKKEEDTVLHIAPSLAFRQDFGKGSLLRLSYKPAYSHHDNPRSGSTEKEWSHAVDFNLDLAIGTRTTIILSDLYWWSGDRDWYYAYDEGQPRDYGHDEKITHNDDFYKNNFNLGISRIVSANNTFFVGAEYNIKRYDEESIARYGDEDEYTFNVNYMQRNSRRLGYGIFAEYTAFDRSNGDGFEPAPITGNETPRVDTGVQYLTAGFQFEYDFTGRRNILILGRTGYKSVTYEAEGIEDDETIGDSRLELSLFPRERTRARIGVRYGREFSDIYPYSSKDNTTFFLIFSQMLDRNGKLRFNSTVEYRVREYEMADIDPDAKNYSGYFKNLWERTGSDGKGYRDTIFANFAILYQWTKELNTSVFYSIEDVESDVDTDYTNNIIGFNFSYQLF